MTPRPPIPIATGDFTILPLTIPPTPIFPHNSTHYIYLKPHSPSIPTPHSGRSLFLANIPVDASFSQFRSFFAQEQLGGARVEDVEFEGVANIKKGTISTASTASKSKKRKRTGLDRDGAELLAKLPPTWDREIHHSGSTAIVIFVDRPSMDAAHKSLKRAVRRHEEIAWTFPHLTQPRLGLSRYRTHHSLRYPSTDIIQSAIDTYITAYSSLEQSHARAIQQRAGVPDEDGFVTVVRGSRVGAAKVDERRAAELKEAAERKKQKEVEKTEGLGDFYRFQGRERRKKEAEGLVKRFEGERKRIYGVMGKKRVGA